MRIIKDLLGWICGDVEQQVFNTVVTVPKGRPAPIIRGPTIYRIDKGKFVDSAFDTLWQREIIRMKLDARKRINHAATLRRRGRNIAKV